MAYDGKLSFETELNVAGFKKGIDEMKSIVKVANVFGPLESALASFGKNLQALGKGNETFSALISGANNAATSVANAAGSVGDVTSTMGKFGNIVSGIAGGIGLLSGAVGIITEVGTAIYNHIMKPTREANESLGQMGEYMATFNEKLERTIPNLSVYASAFGRIDTAQGTAKSSLVAVQTGMTEILRTEVEERDGLMQTDIENYLTYYQQMTGANQILLDTEQTKLQLINDLRAQDLAGQELNNEQYIAFANQHIADAQAQGNTILSLIESQRLAEMAA